ncbi:MAG: DUF6541 family protein [Bacteroidota bacterium]
MTSTGDPMPDPRSRRRSLFRAVVVVVCVAIYVAPLWRSLTTWGGTFDWGYFFFLAEVDRTTVLHYGQFPLWNPYYCGGAVHLANPQTYFLSPTFLFILAFGTPIGVRLTLTLAILLAFDGTRRWMRALGLGPDAATVAGLSYAMSGTIAQHLGGGHVGWVGLCVLPYVLASLHEALAGHTRHMIYGGLFLAWIFGHFGGYTYPYSALCLGTYGLMVGLAQRRPLRALGTIAAMVSLSLGVAAVRLLPILDFVKNHPRIPMDRDRTSPLEWLEIYAVHHRTRAVRGHDYVWPEYGNYLGPIAVALALAGVAVVIARRRRQWPLAAAMLLFLLYQIGNVPGLPWWLTKHLPIFRYMRVPSRFTILVGLFACALLGLAVNHGTAVLAALRARRPALGRALTVAAALVLAVSLVDVLAFNTEQWLPTMTAPAPRDPVSPRFKQMTGSKYRMYAYPRSNQGTISCFEESPLDISPRLRSDLPADEYLADPSAGTLRRVHWSPNRIVVEATLTRPGTVVVNQNWNEHWRVEGGRNSNVGGLLGAALPAGVHVVTFRYLPRPFLIGLAITAASLLLAALAWWRLGLPRARAAPVGERPRVPDSGR